MTERLIVMSGPLAGSDFSLGAETYIGRSPTGDIALTEPGVAWRHCVIRQEDGRHVLHDLRTGRGTFVNGLRVERHVLETNDQIAVGGVVFVYEREAAAEPAADTKPTLLRATALQFVFRALAQSQGEPHQPLLESQAVRIIADLLPCDPSLSGVIALGRTEEGIAARFTDTVFAAFVPRVFQGETVADPGTRSLAVPVFVANKVAGMIGLELPARDPVPASEHLDTLSAVVNLASVALESAREIESLQQQKAILEEQISGGSGILGESPAIRRLLQMVERVAPTESSVLILGESGTGKELVARALHQGSPRAREPFVAINCAAISPNLLESELFGHEKGAFTGAATQKKGRLEVAEGGTVFLDEIGELAAELQAKLLRVLEQREMVRVGGHHTIALDVRVVAATNRDLAAEVKKGKFREDLYHRLNVIALKAPALRERREDIPALAGHFAARAAAQCKRRVTGISAAAERCLVGYSWPGNVRELENAIERAVVLGESEEILREDLPESILDVAPAPEGGFQESVGDTKRACILRAYEQAGGDYKTAAKILGLHPNYLLRLVRNLGLKDAVAARRGR